MSKKMRIVLISDTHEQHDQVSVPDGDILLHSGDFTFTGKRSQYERFANWINNQSHQFKVICAGNHDFGAEHILRPLLNESVYMLNDQGVELLGIKFWGSPFTPRFGNWAFMEERGEGMRKHWDMIPSDTDVLITHGPPSGILDEGIYGSAGCEELHAAYQYIHPQIHVFGHIHGAYGHVKHWDTDFYNASVVNEEYAVSNAPWAVDFESKTKGE